MRICWLVVVGLAGCIASDPSWNDASQLVRKKPKKPKKCKPHKKHQDCGDVTASIGVSGGTVETESGVALTIPFGAVDESTTITITMTDEGAPGATSPVYEFGPEGIVFAKPVTVTLPLPPGVTDAAMYWSRYGSTTEFDPIGGTIDLAAGTITASTFHFSLGYVGQPSGTRAVNGGGSVTWISASSYDIVPIDFATQPVEAIVGDGAGGFTTIEGHATGGGFTIDDVPNGEYILHSGSSYLVTTSATPDLGSHVGGRPNRTPLTTSSLVDLELLGLAPWNAGSATEPADQIEWFSTEADDWDFGTDRFATLTGGETEVVLPIDVANVVGGKPSEIHSAEGYRAAVGQLVLQHTAAPSNVPYLAMKRVAQFPPTFDALSGDAQALTLTLGDVSLGNTLSVDYYGNQFRHVLELYGNPAHFAPDDPSCPTGLCGGFVGALAQAYTANDGFYTANADLLLMYDVSGQHIVSGPMAYADTTALGGTWGVLYDVRWSQRTYQQLPDTSGRAGVGFFGFVDGMEWTTTKEALEAGPITPKVLPPANVTVNAGSFFAGGPDLGGSATISWENANPPPPAPQPVFYTIGVIELSVDAFNLSRGTRIATINTPNTSFTFPTFADPSKQILQPGHAYVFTVTAVTSTSGATKDLERLASSPFKSTIEMATATVSSGIFGDVHGTPLAQTIQAGQSYPAATAASASAVFWTERIDAPWDPQVSRNSGNIWTANLDGSNPHVIASGQDEPSAIAVSGSTLYWINEGDGSDSKVMSMDLLTSAITEVASVPGVHALLAYGGDIYWLSWDGTTRLSNGTMSSVAPVGGVNFATDGTRFYYAEYGDEPPAATGSVQHIPFDGSALPVTLIDGQRQTWGVQTDGAYVYWSNQAWESEGAATINRIPVGGGSPETLVTGNELMKVFTLDATSLYFVRDGFVWSLPKAGGSPSQLAALPDGSWGCPQGTLTVAAGALYFTDTCGMGVYRVPL